VPWLPSPPRGAWPGIPSALEQVVGTLIEWPGMSTGTTSLMEWRA